MILSSDTLSKIALSAPHATRVFAKYRMDFCCGGGTSLSDACIGKGLNSESVLAEIEAAAPLQRSVEADAPLGEVVDHVLSTHHEFTRNIMAEIEKFSVRVAAVHGAQHPEMIVLRDLFAKFKAEMELHLMKEERVLFPYIRLLENGAEKDAPVCFSDVGGPIRMMLFEHENAGEDLRQMRETTSDYTLPPGACNTYRLLFHKLQELEEDVHLHMHIENNLLFPRAMELAANPG